VTPVHAAAAGLLAVVGALSLVWMASVRRRDASIVDIWWGPGFVLLAWLYCVLLEALHPRPLLMAALITAWGARLAWHIFSRHRGAGEDRRYAAMRARHGAAFAWRSLFLVFWLQAALIWFIALPVLAANASPETPLGLLDLAGVLMFAAGFGVETVGDRQLRRFKATPANRGKVLDSGLWLYTRHPNYFGDALLWWGLYLLAASTPAGRLTIPSPALMTFLLVRVSGVMLLERDLRASKPGYAAYIERTSAFVPWFPRRRGDARPPGA
jgi:steroid 5-alpha reductase family enzyme